MKLCCLSGRFLEMHMYMTSALSKNDMKAIGLQMALDLLAKKEKRDSITGLRTRTQPGRPEWGKVRTHCQPEIRTMNPSNHTNVNHNMQSSEIEFRIQNLYQFMWQIFYKKNNPMKMCDVQFIMSVTV